MIVISALPAALAGATWSLFLTDTTLSVPALTGAIMSMGTATANTVLVVDFARAQLAALAMIVGMFQCRSATPPMRPWRVPL
jgi:multidrug efflux pump subunit AcrB